MHIGNVTELILTGNEITSTHGLDRLFSLERLSLDENNICSLANISGIAKLPFLMNLDIVVSKSCLLLYECICTSALVYFMSPNTDIIDIIPSKGNPLEIDGMTHS